VGVLSLNAAGWSKVTQKDPLEPYAIDACQPLRSIALVGALVWEASSVQASAAS
jgi:hypothetical protein